MSTCVTVAVRVRPYLSIDGDKNKFKCGVAMNGPSTQVFSESGQERKFTFDHSFWSFGSKDDHYIDNSGIFDILGNKILNDAWEGYNVTLFAYGQTGSGKSFSIFGGGGDAGIVPRAAEEIFERIKKQDAEQDEKGVEGKDRVHTIVEASMLEIYSEQVRDLLNPGNNPPGGLRIRESPATGPFVEGLSWHSVHTYAEIDKIMDDGDKMRTVEATKMNKTSSRSHTVVTINITQRRKLPNGKWHRDRASKINIVDLAGSEKQKHTGATGARAKEGIAINASLSSLGRVITVLAKKASGQGKNLVVPYRESALTRILQESLGGNSRTIMIAAIRPGINFYTESMSTLRYADSAKKIKNKAVINRDPKDQMIKDLKDEVAKLRKKLEAANVGGTESAGGMDEDQASLIADLQARLLDQQKIMEVVEKQDEEDVEGETLRLAKLRAAALSSVGVVEFDREKLIHIENLQEDPQTSGLIAYPLDHEGEVTVGRKTGDNNPDVILSGLGINVNHAIFHLSGEEVYIEPVGTSIVHVNGESVKEKRKMEDNDRIIFGNNHVFKFVNPFIGCHEEEAQYTWAFAQKEYAEKQGLLKDQQNSEMEEKLKKMEEQLRLKEEEQQKKMEEEKQKMEAIFAEKAKKLEEEAKNKSDLESIKKQLLEEKLQMEERQKELERQLAERNLEEKKSYEAEKKKEEERNAMETEILELIPLIKDANAISTELGGNSEFDLKVYQKFEDGSDVPVSKIGIVVKRLDTGLSAMWEEEEFKDRIYKMKDHYVNYVTSIDNGREWQGFPEGDNPFEDESFDEAQPYGNAMIYMKSLSYLLDNKVDSPILDMGGQQCGEIRVAVIPCDAEGKILEDAYAESGQELLGKELNFLLQIPFARGLNPNQSEDTYVRYKLPIDQTWQETHICHEKTINPKWDYERIVHFPTVTPDLLEYLENQMLNLQVWGKYSIEDKSGEVKHRKGIREYADEAKTYKAERDEFEMNLKYMIEERDNLQDEKDKLNMELTAVLKELDEVQEAFFGSDALKTPKQPNPQSEQKSNGAEVEELQKIIQQKDAEIQNLIQANQKFHLAHSTPGEIIPKETTTTTVTPEPTKKSGVCVIS